MSTKAVLYSALGAALTSNSALVQAVRMARATEFFTSTIYEKVTETTTTTIYVEPSEPFTTVRNTFSVGNPQAPMQTKTATTLITQYEHVYETILIDENGNTITPDATTTTARATSYITVHTTLAETSATLTPHACKAPPPASTLVTLPLSSSVVVAPPPPKPTTAISPLLPPRPSSSQATSSEAPPPPPPPPPPPARASHIKPTPPASSDAPGVFAPLPKGKRGLAYADAQYTKNFGGPGSKVSWAYNWNSDRYANSQQQRVAVGSFNTAIQYVPMLWGYNSDVTSKWGTQVSQRTTDDSAGQMPMDCFMLFNEPDHCGGGGSCQSCGSGDASCVNDIPKAVDIYRTIFSQPLAADARIGTPAVTNSPLGLPWLQAFLKQCSGCKFDFAQMHYYTDPATPFQNFIDQATAFHDAVQMPVWVTEFAYAPGATLEQNKRFLKQAMEWMDGTEWIERYSWFIAGPNDNGNTWGLTNGDGSLSDLGRMFDQD